MITREELGLPVSDYDTLHRENTDIRYEILTHLPPLSQSGEWAVPVYTMNDWSLYDAVGKDFTNAPGSQAANGLLSVFDQQTIRLYRATNNPQLTKTDFDAAGDPLFVPTPDIRPRFLLIDEDSFTTHAYYYVWGQQNGTGAYRLWRYEIRSSIHAEPQPGVFGSTIIESATLLWDTATINPGLIVEELPTPSFVSSTAPINEQYPIENVLNGFSNPDNSYMLPFPTSTPSAASLIMDMNPLAGVKPDLLILRYGTNDENVLRKMELFPIPGISESDLPTGPFTSVNTNLGLDTTLSTNSMKVYRWFTDQGPTKRYVSLGTALYTYTNETTEVPPHLGEIVFARTRTAPIYTEPTMNPDGSQTLYHLIPDNVDANGMTDNWWRLYVNTTPTNYYFPGPFFDVEMRRSNKRGELYIIVYRNEGGHIGKAFDSFLDEAYSTQENNQVIQAYRVSIDISNGAVNRVAGPFDIERITSIEPGMERRPISLVETGDRLILFTRYLDGVSEDAGGISALQYFQSPDGKNWSMPRFAIANIGKTSMTKAVFTDHSDGVGSYLYGSIGGSPLAINAGKELGMSERTDMVDVTDYLMSGTIQKVNLASGRLEFDYSNATATSRPLPDYLASQSSAPRLIIKAGYKNRVTGKYVTIPITKLYVDSSTITVTGSTSRRGESRTDMTLSVIGKDRMTFMNDRIRAKDAIFLPSQLQFGSVFTSQVGVAETLPKHWASLEGEWITVLNRFTTSEPNKTAIAPKSNGQSGQNSFAAATYDFDVGEFDASVRVNMGIVAKDLEARSGIFCHYADENNFTALVVGYRTSGSGNTQRVWKLIRRNDGVETELFTQNITMDTPHTLRLQYRNGVYSFWLTDTHNIWDNSITTTATILTGSFRDDQKVLPRNAPSVRAEEGPGKRGQIGIITYTEKGKSSRDGQPITYFTDFQFSDFAPPMTMQDAIKYVANSGGITNVELDGLWYPGKNKFSKNTPFSENWYTSRPTFSTGFWSDVGTPFWGISGVVEDFESKTSVFDLTGESLGTKIFFRRHDKSDTTLGVESENESVKPTATFELTLDMNYNNASLAGTKIFGIGIGQHTRPLDSRENERYGWPEDGYEVQYNFENGVLRFLRHTGHNDDIFTVLAEFSITPNVNDIYQIRVSSREIQFSSDKGDKWLMFSAFLDHELVGYHAVQISGTSVREDNWNWGFTFVGGVSAKISNYNIHELAESIDVVSIDPGETAISALRRIIAGKHLRMFMRYNETLKITNPFYARNVSNAAEFLEPEQYRVQYNAGSRATHVRVTGAYVSAESLSSSLHKLEHRFQQINNPYIATVADALAEANRILNGFQEVGNIVEVHAPLRPLMENEDVIALNQIPHGFEFIYDPFISKFDKMNVFFVNDIRITFMPGEISTIYTLRGNPNAKEV
ncbi:MAG: hypothetical protein CUN55_00565 [Phototrophicales bacterium]|nr:MAG: hypothetical protein CUN55_00565 [Phototrophicales bacterium]